MISHIHFQIMFFFILLYAMRVQ